MEKNDFNKFCDIVIDKYIEELKELDQDYNSLTVRKNRKKMAYIFYEKKRMKVRKYFMNLESKPMDRHKIASVMIYAILNSKIIKVNKMIPNLPDTLLMANEYLAFNVALNIIEMYKRDQGKQYKNYSIIVPITYHEDMDNQFSRYINNTCKALYYLGTMRKYDLFAYSNILFLLEKYTDKLIEYEKV